MLLSCVKYIRIPAVLMKLTMQYVSMFPNLAQYS